MKRFLAALLAPALLLLTACSSLPSEAPSSNDTNSPADGILSTVQSGTPAAAPSAPSVPTAPSTPSAPATPAAPSGGNGSDSDISLDNIQSIEDLTDILSRFTLLSYEFNSPDSRSTVTVQMHGQQNISGAPADYVTVDILDEGSESTQMEIWLNAKGETVKMVNDGEEIPAAMVSSMGGLLLLGVFWPFMMTDQMNLAQIVEEGNDSSLYHVSKVTKQHRNFGKTAADVYVIDVGLRNVDAQGGYTWEVADFGQFQMFVGWEINITDAGGNDRSTFRVLEIGLR